MKEFHWAIIISQVVAAGTYLYFPYKSEPTVTKVVAVCRYEKDQDRVPEAARNVVDPKAIKTITIRK